MKREYDIASFFTWGIALLTLFFDHFMFFSKSRIDLKNGLKAIDSLGDGFWILIILMFVTFILIILEALKKNSIFNILIGVFSCVSIVVTIYFAGQCAANFPSDSSNLRVSLSIGAYIFILQMILLTEKYLSSFNKRYFNLMAYLFILISIAVLIINGNLSHLSILKEFYAREDQFLCEFMKHFQMVCAVLSSSIIIGVSLGWFMTKNIHVRNIVSFILNTVEAIPSVAFMFLIMFPLAFINRTFPIAEKLGISGIGATPVFIGLLFYSLFHIVNCVYSSMYNLEEKYIEVARGMGMSSFQIFLNVELPLALPIILSGIKVASTVTISGAILGAFVGFGGLGIFILQGSSGFAIDLILLGALPILFLIFIFNLMIDILNSLILVILHRRGSVTR